MTAKQETTNVSLQSETVFEWGLPPVVKMEEQDPADSMPEEKLKSVRKPTFVIQAGTSEEFLRWVALPQSRNQHQETEGRWEVQRPEMVVPQVTSASSPAWGNLQVPQLTVADDIEVYLSTFERVADVCQWPREQWVVRLVPALSGAAQEVYNSLNLRDREDYEKVKAAILCCCDIGCETRRQRFRQFGFQEAGDPRQACGYLRELCHRWLKPEIRTKEQILELLILEQFLNILPEKIQTWVWECHPETCAQAVALVEEFTFRQQEAKKSDLQVTVGMKVEEVTSEEELTSPAPLWDVPGSQSHPTCHAQEAVGRNEPLEARHGLPREETQPPQEIAGARTAHQTAATPSVDDPVAPEMPRDIWRNMAEATSSEWEEDKHPGEQDGSSEDELAIQTRGPRECPAFLRSLALKTREEPKGTESQARAFFWGEKPHQCRECGDSFRAKQELALHKGIHRRERPFPCAVCGKRFTRLYHLTTHLRIHSGEKPYHCIECGKRYADASNFYKHQRSHAAEKPYQCAECGKTFGDQSHFYKHQKGHRGDRPYICNACGDCFSKQKDLVAHQKIHEDGRVPSLY
ncbi:zinc finger protein with KRAB and SCAN domains 1-like [Eublepharis macularius]|uniref:Zinc finger protein with KRAB and SCAN domains 1-like n=1 Tax=Eublepharis macularius TaxID=481883 RepID=A0AA97K5D0_EUBMA|nr:zinc finger protein with KRAB and SCAN domains 1-like [Eublepharis macularius]